ncbi:MAG: sulfite exporter TauE/SafE family protein [Bdellovibrionota bacterium]
MLVQANDMHHHHGQVFEAATLSSFFILGLFGSTHCIGMCGPLTCMIFKNQNAKKSIFFYHFSRLISYSTVVLALVMIGSFTIKNMMWNRLSDLLLWAIIAFVALQVIKYLVAPQIQTVFTKLADTRLFPIGIGLITGLLPCGLLIPAYIGASSMSSKAMSLVAIFLFFMGTLPALLMSQTLIQKLKQKLPRSLYPWINPSLGVIFLVIQLIMMRRMS